MWSTEPGSRESGSSEPRSTEFIRCSMAFGQASACADAPSSSSPGHRHNVGRVRTRMRPRPRRMRIPAHRVRSSNCAQGGRVYPPNQSWKDDVIQTRPYSRLTYGRCRRVGHPPQAEARQPSAMVGAGLNLVRQACPVRAVNPPSPCTVGRTRAHRRDRARPVLVIVAKRSAMCMNPHSPWPQSALSVSRVVTDASSPSR